ncbi:MAG: tetratricopeptide repeat protein [Alphaproteobacteria bacterium]
MYNKAEFEKALKAIDLEIENNPENTDAWGTKATLLLKLAELTDSDDVEKAHYLQGGIDSATVGLSQDGNELRLWDLLATCHIQMANVVGNEESEAQHLDKALYAIEQALIISDKLAGFWFVKGFIYDRKGDSDKARLAFDKATLLDINLIDELPDEYKAEYGQTSSGF